MRSRIYFGHIRHRRHQPTPHAFKYRTYLLYLDIDELDTVFAKFWFWSVNKFNVASFWRKDYIGNPKQSLRESINEKIEAQYGAVSTGPISVLTQLKHCGYCFNPVTFYYCFDKFGQSIDFVLAEINNTPWDEKYTYVFDNRMGQLSRENGEYIEMFFKKDFHVSPFMPMDMHYFWRFSFPEEKLSIHMENIKALEKYFDATLTLKASPIDSKSLSKALFLYPLMSLKVVTAIYWNALKLWFKGIKFYDNPKIANQRQQLHKSKNS